MKKLIIIIVLCITAGYLHAQVIPDSMRVDWSQTGYEGVLPDPENAIDVTDYGAIGDGVTNDFDAINSAIEDASAQQGVVYFPKGTYLLKAPLIMPPNVILRGLDVDSSALHFDLDEQALNCISITGNAGNDFIPVTDGLEKGSETLTLESASGFTAGDYAVIRQENGEWDNEPAPWAEKVVGQVVKVLEVSGQNISIDQALRIDYEPELNPEIRKIEPIMDVGIECLKIHRRDSVLEGPGSNVEMNMAVNCWVIGVESYKSVSAHIDIVNSKNILITGNYIHHAFTYDGEGKRGYGVTLNHHTSDCLIENNIFRHLRHAMMVKTGANGNVFAYNHSTEPVRPEFPSDAGGDISLHGHYPFANLFEGNIIQNIVIDHYWGPAGPYNTFFRNRAELYGIISTQAEVETNMQSFVGNEVTNTQALHGLYSLSGEDHFEYGNNVKGTVVPQGTDDLSDISYYLDEEPLFWTIASDWPSIGIPNELNTGTIPAEVRYLNGTELTLCRDEFTGNPQKELSNEVFLFPNPAEENVVIQFNETSAGPAEEVYIKLCDIKGKILLKKSSLQSGSIQIALPESIKTGMYLLHIETMGQKSVHKLFIH